MKICFLANAASPHTRHWTRYFLERGHEVSVISLEPSTPEPGIELHVMRQPRRTRIEKTNWHYLLSLSGMRRLVRRIQPDLLNAHYLASYGFLGSVIKPRGCAMVASLHGSDILLTPQKSFLHAWATRFALRRAALITSVAQHMTNALSRYAPPDTPVLTLQYGIETSRFHPPEEESTRRPVLISTRRFEPLANIDTILEAVAELRGSGPGLRLTVCNDGDLEPQLKRRVRELELGDRVEFVGPIAQDRLAEALRLSAIYVSMTSSDGASLSLLEAMACGAFPVVSDIPANREWIDDGRNGMLVPLGATGELARRIGEAWERSELRRRAAELNWDLVRERADYAKNMETLEAAFVDLVGRRGEGS